MASQSSSCLRLGLWIWDRDRQVGYSGELWTYFARVLTGRAVIQTMQTLVESLQNVRAQRGRKCSDSFPLETWQAARQNFGTSPANKLHAAFRQLTPWLLNPTNDTVFPYLCSSCMECASSHLFGNPWAFSSVGSTSL